MSRVMIIAGLASSLIRFRGDLINQWLDLGHEVFALGPGFEVKEELENRGVKYFTIPLKRTGLNPLEDLFLLFKLFKMVRHHKPDYMFLYTVKPVIYGSMAAMILPKCRVFSMITGLGYVFTDTVKTGLKSRLKCLIIGLYRFSLKRNEKIFFQNPDDLKLFHELGLIESEKAVLTNGSGVNLDYFKLVALPTERPVFLLIARLLQEKGIAVYFEAARRVSLKYPEIEFILVGWQLGGGASEIQPDQIEIWRESGYVKIHGYAEDVRPYIAASSVYVLPSYREGTPRTVLEAMAMGRPVITTDVPGCRETVIDGVNGFLVPVKNEEALVEAMERFIREPELVAKMGAESRRIVEEKYNVHKVNKVINQAMGLQ